MENPRTLESKGPRPLGCPKTFLKITATKEWFTLFSSQPWGSSNLSRTIYVWIIVLLHSISKRKNQEVRSPRSPRPLGCPKTILKITATKEWFTLLSSQPMGSFKLFRTIHVWIIVLLHSISKRKNQEPLSPRPQDLLGVPKLFWKSVQQKSDSHCSRANSNDHLSFSAP
jgi:tRNA (Thr-GGU) A37 N-methylase